MSRDAKIAPGVHMLARAGRITLDLDERAARRASFDVDKQALLAFVLSSGAYTALDLQAFAATAAGNIKVSTLVDIGAAIARRLEK